MEEWIKLLIAALGGGTLIQLGNWAASLYVKRHDMAVADDERTVKAWKDYAQKREEDVTQIRKEMAALRDDFSARMMRAENENRDTQREVEHERKRRYRCEKRWELSETKIDDLQFAIDRFNELQEKAGKPERVIYRKHVRPDDEDDSRLDVPTPAGGPVVLHGPGDPSPFQDEGE